MSLTACSTGLCSAWISLHLSQVNWLHGLVFMHIKCVKGSLVAPVAFHPIPNALWEDVRGLCRQSLWCIQGNCTPNQSFVYNISSDDNSAFCEVTQSAACCCNCPPIHRCGTEGSIYDCGWVEPLWWFDYKKLRKSSQWDEIAKTNLTGSLKGRDTMFFCGKANECRMCANTHELVLY